MNDLLNILTSEQALGYITTLFGGSAVTGLAVARKLGLKPVALIGSLFRRKKNPIKELMDVVQAVRDDKPKDEIADEVIDLIESLKPMLKGSK